MFSLFVSQSGIAEPYQNVVEMLRNLHMHVTPTAKLHAVVSVVRQIVSLIETFFSSAPEDKVG